MADTANLPAKQKEGSPKAEVTPTAAHVFQAMANVQAKLSEIGIAKTRGGAGINYAFRGIDAVMNTLAPILSEQKLMIVPRVAERTCDVRQAKSGSAMYFVVVKVEFLLVSGVDGSSFSGTTIGEAQDTGDKATNKAMSIAYKYFCFQTFCIPLDAQDDPDAHAVEQTVAPKQPDQKVTPVKPVAPKDMAPADRMKNFKIALSNAKDSDDAIVTWESPKAEALREVLSEDQNKELASYYGQVLSRFQEGAFA